jgi:hypothetical protein
MIALRLLGWLWCLPVTLIGLVVVAFARPRSVRFRWHGHHGVRGVVEFTVARWFKGYAAFTFGAVQWYVEGKDPERHRRHEDVHTLQGFILGALNPLAYGLMAAALYVYWRWRTEDHGLAMQQAYWHNPLEAWARAWSRR